MTKAQAKDMWERAKSGYELWQTAIGGAASDSRWQYYDCDLQRIVNQFNPHLSRTTGY